MKTATSMRLVRLLWYVSILIGLPALVVGSWWLLQEFNIEFETFSFLVVSQVVVSLIILVILTKLLHRIPNTHDEELAHLLKAQEEYVVLYEHSPVPYLTLDSAGKITRYNLATVRLFATTTELLLGRFFVDTLVDKDESNIKELAQAIKYQRTVKEVEVQIRTDKKQVRWVQLSFFVNKESRQNLVALVDITHQKEVDAAKSEFVALATHQLRTPIAAIRWNLEMLGRQLPDTLSDNGRRYFEKIEQNTARMIALINDFLSASQLEMGTFSTAVSQVSIVSFFDTILDEYMQTIEQNNITIERIYDSEEVTVTTDTRLLHIIVSNLISNAVKYVPVGGTVQVRFAVKKPKWEIEIVDTGIGIPDKEQDELFSKFFRATNARVQQAEGTGLGLYVVQQSVEKLSGTIQVVSKENVGTRFFVTLPYTP